jgi:catechol 2,3-dioxygenase-like lactoylglutathione lyase family enzyme
MRGSIRVVIAIAGALGCGDDAPSGWQRAARACAHDGDLSCATPIFNVHDLRRSQRYYRDQLGFKVDWEDGKPPDFTSVTRGHGTLFLCRGCQGNPGGWAMMFHPDVDKLHRELRGRKAIIRMPPTDMPWHLRELHVSDPDGNVLRFGSSREH